MEGYLRVQLKRFFGGPVQRWVVLDGQQITFYDHLDLENQVAVGVKATFLVQNADIVKFSDSKIEYGLAIKAGHTNIKFDCENPSTCSTWYNSLLRATKLHTEENARYAANLHNCRILELDEEKDELSTKKIAKAYRKLCLIKHPDKGGSIASFNEIKDAYNTLMAQYSNIEEIENCTVVIYEAIIEKIEVVGLGLVVAEDKIRQQIVVQRVAENTQLIGLSAEANDEILAGDAVVGIDHDDCTNWTISRVRARLGPLRAPVGRRVHFTLERRVSNYALEPSQEFREIPHDESSSSLSSLQVHTADANTATATTKSKSEVAADSGVSDEESVGDDSDYVGDDVDDDQEDEKEDDDSGSDGNSDVNDTEKDEDDAEDEEGSIEDGTKLEINDDNHSDEIDNHSCGVRGEEGEEEKMKSIDLARSNDSDHGNIEDGTVNCGSTPAQYDSNLDEERFIYMKTKSAARSNIRVKNAPIPLISSDGHFIWQNSPCKETTMFDTSSTSSLHNQAAEAQCDIDAFGVKPVASNTSKVDSERLGAVDESTLISESNNKWSRSSPSPSPSSPVKRQSASLKAKLAAYRNQAAAKEGQAIRFEMLSISLEHQVTELQTNLLAARNQLQLDSVLFDQMHNEREEMETHIASMKAANQRRQGYRCAADNMSDTLFNSALAQRVERLQSELEASNQEIAALSQFTSTLVTKDLKRNDTFLASDNLSITHHRAVRLAEQGALYKSREENAKLLESLVLSVLTSK